MTLEDSEEYANPGPTREEIDSMPGKVLLEFGTDWCGHCQGLKPHVTSLLKQYPSVTHIKVEDGKGRPLGRSFRVKLWPTLILLRDGTVVRQLVRPGVAELQEGLKALTNSG